MRHKDKIEQKLKNLTSILFLLLILNVFVNRSILAQDYVMKIKITINDTKTITATMEDNSAAQDFLSLLPLSLSLEDYHKTEKVGDLPKKLDTTNVPSGHNPSIGDITYYAPWGNLAIFYKDFGYAGGLVPLAKLDSDPGAFNINGSLNIKIEKLEQ